MFLERLDDLAILLRIARARTDMREAKMELVDRALVILDPEALGHERLQVDPPPAHNAVDSAVGAGLDKGGQVDQLRLREPAWIAPPAVVLQPRRPLLVEPGGPVSQRLTVHPANPRRLRPAHPVKHGRDRQEPAALVRILRPRCQPAKLGRRMAALDLDHLRHGGRPPRHVESHQSDPGTPIESLRKAVGISDGVGAERYCQLHLLYRLPSVLQCRACM